MRGMRRGGRMNATPDGTAAGSWMQRARPDDSRRRPPVGHSDTSQSLPPRSESQGWDPYEVWLTRIEWPRRRRSSYPAT